MDDNARTHRVIVEESKGIACMENIYTIFSNINSFTFADCDRV